MASVHPSPYLLVTDMVLTTVKPFQKTAHVETIDPTFMDAGFADIYVPTLYAYRPSDKSDAGYLQLVNRIKDSLQKVLVPFFPFAGRGIATSEGSSGRRLLCNDEGVPFIEAYVNKDLDSVVDASVAFQAVPELHGYDVVGMDMTLLKQKMQKRGLPCIFVQITRFKCGGVVLAVTFSHMCTDTKGFFNFMTAWSDLSLSNETAVKVDHNRSLADVPSLTKLFQERDTDIGRDASGSGENGDKSAVPKGEWPKKTFEVNASAVKSVKQEAKTIRNGPGFVSTVDCIHAHLWQSLSRLPSSVSGGKEVAISMTVEGRSKFYDPPLSDGLFGNVIAPMQPPKIAREELQEMSLASSAGEIRKQLQSIRREEWHGTQRWKEMLDAFESGDSQAAMPITSWFKFPLYEMDFGIGRPFFASRVNNFWTFGRPAAYVASAYIGPPIPSSSSSVATVSIWSTLGVLEALESDPLFQSFFIA